MDAPSIDRLLAGLFPAPRPGGTPAAVYAVLDGARDDRLYRAIYDSRLDHQCLFAGDLSYDLATAAPYLVELGRDAAFTRWLLEEGWGKSFGIFAAASADLETLRRHFRRLLQVKDPLQHKLYFRFYDPRVLRVYLPTCKPGELRELFGPLARLMMESEDGKLLAFDPSGRLAS